MLDLTSGCSARHVTRHFCFFVNTDVETSRLLLSVAHVCGGAVVYPGVMGVTSQLKARLGEERYRLLQVSTSHPLSPPSYRI